MGTISTLFSLPVSGPLGAVAWLARQVAGAANQMMLDPARIERELILLEQQLDAGQIDEVEFERREAELLVELEQIRAARDTQQADVNDTSTDQETAPLSSELQHDHQVSVGEKEVIWTIT